MGVYIWVYTPLYTVGVPYSQLSHGIAGAMVGITCHQDELGIMWM